MLPSESLQVANIDTFRYANNKGTDQTAQMRRLVNAFVVSIPQYYIFHSEVHIPN